MTTWTLCLLLLGAFSALVLKPQHSRFREFASMSWRQVFEAFAWWRTFAAMLAASVAGKVFPDPVAWVLIDLTAAIIVIFPPRIGFQKAIAALFGAMLFLELGWLWSNRLNVEYIVNAGSLFGWLQLAALLTWGVDDRYGISRILDWLVGSHLARARVDAG